MRSVTLKIVVVCVSSVTAEACSSTKVSKSVSTRGLPSGTDGGVQIVSRCIAAGPRNDGRYDDTRTQGLSLLNCQLDVLPCLRNCVPVDTNIIGAAIDHKRISCVCASPSHVTDWAHDADIGNVLTTNSPILNIVFFVQRQISRPGRGTVSRCDR